jgi:hypothetical protein
MDVPASHWAYDAVSQLAARGVISGYPDGTFKGAQPATRYEIGSIIARSLAYVDLDKASKQDVEMLKRLIVEFSDELSALGVKVDDVDSRLGVLQDDIGGWKISGLFEFNAKFGAGDPLLVYGPGGNLSASRDFNSITADFQLAKYRIFLDKRISETTSFHSRFAKGSSGTGGNEPVVWDRYYITTQLGYGITLDAGRFNFDWEGDLGFYTSNDAWVGDITINAFRFRKDWGIANLELVLGRDGSLADYVPRPGGGYFIDSDQRFLLAALANFNFSEKVSGGVMFYGDFYEDAEGRYYNNNNNNIDGSLTYGIYGKFKFHPGAELKAIYYGQSWDEWYPAGYVLPSDYDDDGKAWKAILELDQDLLKFTSLWIEYGKIDNNFNWNGGAYDDFDSGLDPFGLVDLDFYVVDQSGFAWGPVGYDSRGTSTVFGAKAAQKWNDKWDTWIRYYQYDLDSRGLDDVKDLGIGIGYQLNPAVHFELAYDKIDYGSITYSDPAGVNPTVTGAGFDNHLIRFQTVVNF